MEKDSLLSRADLNLAIFTLRRDAENLRRDAERQLTISYNLESLAKKLEKQLEAVYGSS